MNNPRLQLDRSRGLGDLISDTFAFLTPHWGTFAAAAGPIVAMNIILQLLVFVLTPDASRLEEPDVTAAEVQDYFEDFATSLAPLLLLIPVIWVVGQLATAGVVIVLKSVGEGKPVSAGDALDEAQNRAKDILLASLKSSVLLFLFAITIIGIPYAIYKAIRWVFLTQCIMVDGVSHREALSRSESYVAGRWWLTFGRLLILGILVQIFGGTVGSIIGGILPDVPGIIAGGCVGFLTQPWMIIATTLMFYDYHYRNTPRPAPPPAEPSVPNAGEQT